jgi:lysophospholipase L1-like esterase
MQFCAGNIALYVKGTKTIKTSFMEDSMNIRLRYVSLHALLTIFFATAVPPLQAQHWVSYEDNTRYLALGDSLSAGYGAYPATNGFVYRLYQSGAIDNLNNTLLCNIGVVNATSKDVLAHQLPLGALFFSDTGVDYRKIVTLTVGGNDMIALIGSLMDPSLDPAQIAQIVNNTLLTYSANLCAILGNLISYSNIQIYVANQYDPQLPIPGEADLVHALNNAIAMVVSGFPQAKVVDISSAFEGKKGLLLIEKKGADKYQDHPTNAGYEVMAKAFADAIREANQ